MQGKVVQSTGAWYQVKGSNGMVYPCKLRGKLRLQDFRLTNPVVVGDEVAFEPATAEAAGVIHGIMPRKNFLMRQATQKKAFGQLLAANLDQSLLITTAVNIDEQLGFIDRFLVVSEAFKVSPVIIFNKVDLLSAGQQTALANIQALYVSLGYKTLAMSAYTQENLPRLKQLLTKKTSLLSGYSGVGKSTLLNMLSPEARQTVALTDPLRKQGQHTTTYTAMFEVAPETFVMDSPGIQTLIPYAIEQQAFSHYFPEIQRLAASCQFYNCTHLHEPRCAVRQALATGAIAASRYTSYQTIMNSIE